MPSERPPTIDPIAAARWARTVPQESPWLHEEVARRMAQRLEWIVIQPQAWLHWEPLRGGLHAQALLAQRYPRATSYIFHSEPAHQALAARRLAVPWWGPARWRGPVVRFARPEQPVHMLWANMGLHMHSDPQALVQQWHQHLEVDGFLMFSCLGPDTLSAVRRVYAQMGWPAASHQFTDMHDWGDMLVHAGFAEPVMDMERITLSFSSAQALLDELRTLGHNLHPQRFAGLRTPAWKQQLLHALQTALTPGGAAERLEISFEIIYGHAFKAAPKPKMQAQTALSLQEMRQMLKQPKN